MSCRCPSAGAQIADGLLTRGADASKSRRRAANAIGAPEREQPRIPGRHCGPPEGFCPIGLSASAITTDPSWGRRRISPKVYYRNSRVEIEAAWCSILLPIAAPARPTLSAPGLNGIRPRQRDQEVVVGGGGLRFGSHAIRRSGRLDGLPDPRGFPCDLGLGRAGAFWGRPSGPVQLCSRRGPPGGRRRNRRATDAGPAAAAAC